MQADGVAAVRGLGEKVVALEAECSALKAQMSTERAAHEQALSTSERLLATERATVKELERHLYKCKEESRHEAAASREREASAHAAAARVEQQLLANRESAARDETRAEMAAHNDALSSACADTQRWRAAYDAERVKVAQVHEKLMQSTARVERQLADVKRIADSEVEYARGLAATERESGEEAIRLLTLEAHEAMSQLKKMVDGGKWDADALKSFEEATRLQLDAISERAARAATPAAAAKAHSTASGEGDGGDGLGEKAMLLTVGLSYEQVWSCLFWGLLAPQLPANL